MNKIRIIILLISIVSFISCNKNSIENYQAILNEYQEIIETNPNNIGEIYLKRAKHYIKYNKYDSALKDIDKILSLSIDNKKRAEILATKAWVELLNKETQIKINKKLQKEILKDINESIKLNNNEPLAYISLALFYAYANDLEKMTLNANKAIEIDKNNIEILYKKARTFLLWSSQTDDVFKGLLQQKALDIYDSIIENFPSNKEYFQKIYFNRGYIYGTEKEYTIAIDNYTKALKLSDNMLLSAKCYFNRGLSYKKLGKYKKAISDFKKFQNITEKYKLETEDISKSYHFVYETLGVCFYRIKKYEDAIYYLNSYIDHKKTDDDSLLISEAYYIRGCAYYNMTGKDDLALKDLYHALNVVTDDEFKKSINETIGDIRRIKNKNKTLYPVDRRFISGDDIRMYIAMNENYIYVIFPEIRVFEGKGFRFEYGDWQTKIVSSDRITGNIVYELWTTDEVMRECKDAIAVAKAYYS